MFDVVFTEEQGPIKTFTLWEEACNYYYRVNVFLNRDSMLKHANKLLQNYPEIKGYFKGGGISHLIDVEGLPMLFIPTIDKEEDTFIEGAFLKKGVCMGQVFLDVKEFDLVNASRISFHLAHSFLFFLQKEEFLVKDFVKGGDVFLDIQSYFLKDLEDRMSELVEEFFGYDPGDDE
ncbi:MAG: hypothetical protein GF311_28475 [Candidatus Lokiarchaeota archaeon]|nr:hypothetical protein [Candidatus Lokiarchaeota archaeon]